MALSTAGNPSHPPPIVPEPPGPAPDRAPDWVAAGTAEPLRSQLVAALGADRVLTRALDPFDACVSSNRTCEIALQQVTGRPYESLVLTLEELTR